MINRIAFKSDKISVSETYLCLGFETPVEIPLASIDAVQFYPAREKECGYLVVVKNDYEDADILFFHSKYQAHFLAISEKINLSKAPAQKIEL